jgi:lipopolysaccharide biosynthesis protein
MSFANLRARVIAFYLPQFHPIPENDAWWGQGFTEWTNVQKARPLFKGHAQPVIPGELGYYDLRQPEVRERQAALAREYGIEAFCYWHYWFAGKQLLERPMREVIQSKRPEFPFCVAWANESWTGIWHGAPNRILIEQTYPGEDDDRRHFAYLLTLFSDPRYLRVDGCPLLVIYKPCAMPEAVRRFKLWRELAREAGLPGLHIVGFNMGEFTDEAQFGLDASLTYHLGQTSRYRFLRRLERRYWGLRRRLPWYSLRRIDYAQALRNHLPAESTEQSLNYPCAVPNWDNTPRSAKRGLVLTGSAPAAFGRHLADAIKTTERLPPSHRLVFIKSWNEWAEGNYLEPDAMHGRAWLEAVRRAVVIGP